jgi:trk system potassium uptake protein TrkH
MNFVMFANGAVLVFFSVLMALDALVFQDTARDFLGAAVVAFLVGASLCLAVLSRVGDFTSRHTFLLTATVWLSAALVGGLPLYLWSLSFTDAFFEAISGITTTGSTVMSGLDSTPHGILLWRGLLQWMGGIGFIVTGIALLPIMKVGGMQLFRTESSDTGEKELGSATRFAGASFWAYAALTLLCGITYFAGGMTGFEAVVHALTTLSTGGYSTSDASFGHFESPFLQWAGTLFMVLASVPFVWYIRAVVLRQFESEQVRVFLKVMVVAILGLTLWRISTADVPFFEALRYVAFNVASVVSSTGYATADYTTWGAFAAAAFLVLSMVGGCTGSTAGGAKIMRWIILVRSARIILGRMRHPHRIFRLEYEGQKVQDGVLDGVISYLTMFFLTIAVLAVALSFAGLDFTTASSAAITAIANVGPGVGDIIGPAGNFSGLPDSAKWIIGFGMYLGRLEMLTVYVVFTAGYWRNL